MNQDVPKNQDQDRIVPVPVAEEDHKPEADVRKKFHGLKRNPVVFTTKVRRSRWLVFPIALVRLLGWHAGQRLRIKATETGLTLTVPRGSRAERLGPQRKQSAMDQMRLERSWQQAMRRLPQGADGKHRSYQPGRLKLGLHLPFDG